MTIDKTSLGGGCFWCLEAIFTQINGVIKVASGYAGGNKSNPTYQEVCSEITGHAECVEQSGCRLEGTTIEGENTIISSTIPTADLSGTIFTNSSINSIGSL